MDERYERLVAALREPSAYEQEGLPADALIEVVETHVSHLFMTDALVYKIKKPVQFEFIDLSTLERRRVNCEEELALNRRLSPEVYLDVLPVTERDGVVRVDGEGEVVDWVVKMLRLPRERMLDSRLAAHEASVADMEQVARYVARFHEAAKTSEEITQRGGFGTLARLVRENFPQTERFVGTLVDRSSIEMIAAYSRSYLEQRESLFRAREAEGRIRDGHGDLHAAHVCLGETISVIDCLEFSPDYRYGDTALDVAFLVMDLDHYGRADLSAALVDAYVASSRDDGALELLTFYKCYRAMVRAKIAAIRFETAGDRVSRNEAEREAREYFALALRYAMTALPKHSLLVVVGLPGAGKSTLAKALAGSRRPVSSDIERKRLGGLLPREHHYVPYGTGLYSEEFNRLTHDAVIEKALGRFRRMAMGYVVVDASLREPAYRERLVREAEAKGIDVWLIEAVASPEVIRERIAARTARGDDPSDATTVIFERAREDWVAVREVGAERHLVVDTDRDVSEVVGEVFGALFGAGVARARA